MLTALLDTCVLWPSLQRDFLLSLAIEGLYRPAWSAAILNELEFHEEAKLTRRGEAAPAARRRAQVLVAQMRSAFETAEVTGWEHLDGTFGLPDRDDEHVVAAAVVVGADAIVTANVKDFPDWRLPSGLQVLQPHEFAADMVSVDPARASVAVAMMAQRSGRIGPKFSEDDVLDLLCARYGLYDAVALLRP